MQIQEAVRQLQEAFEEETGITPTININVHSISWDGGKRQTRSFTEANRVGNRLARALGVRRKRLRGTGESGWFKIEPDKNTEFTLFFRRNNHREVER